MTGTSKRIAQNTILLYIRMMVIMAVNLYIVRIVINGLGQQDYGIYNVVAGLVTMLTSVSTVLSSATMRYYSYHIGRKEDNLLKELFSASINIYIVFSLLVIIISEIVGTSFVNSQLNIPSDRMETVNWIFQFSIFSFVFTIMASPYSAAIIAHERMGLYAAVSLLDCFLKLTAAIAITLFDIDRLFLYGLFLMFVYIVVLIIYIIIGSNFKECHYGRVRNKNLYGKLLSFSGWSMYGSLANVCNMQGNTILVNIFFGPLVNGARAMALHLGTAIQMFSESFVTAIKPPLIKSYAEQDYNLMYNIFNFSNKFIYYCLLMFCIPLIFEMDFVLKIWIGNTDSDMIVFSQFMVVYSMIVSLHSPITIMMMAAVKVKKYFLSVESFMLLCMPITYVLFKFGCPAYSTFLVLVVVAILAHAVRLLILKVTFRDYSLVHYFKVFILPALFITIVLLLLMFLLNDLLPTGILRLIFETCISVLTVSILVYFAVLSKQERQLLLNIVKKVKSKQ